MVIQRRRAAGSGPSIAPLESTNQISSSDESDGSWDNQKSEDLDVLRTINERLTRSRSSEGGARGSLDLLRVNLQSSFDMEVAELVQKYKEKFFEKAYRNLRSSLGEHALSDEDLLGVLQKMVQESAIQFSGPSPSSSVKLTFGPLASNPSPLFDFSDTESSLDTIPTSLPLFNATFQKYSPFPLWKSSSIGQVVAARKRKRTAQGDVQGTTVPVKCPSSFEILHSTLTRPSSSGSSSASQWGSIATWNTSALTKDTQFVLESQANKLFATEIAAQHPELIRYSPDNQEDLKWLVSERIVPATHRNHGSVQLLARDEVVKLKLREQPEWRESSFMGFKVPEFMLRKMHKFFTELSTRKQRIRTNSGYFDKVTTCVREKAGAETGGSRGSGSRKSLSTSHATLSALLGNCSDMQDN